MNNAIHVMKKDLPASQKHKIPFGYTVTPYTLSTLQAYDTRHVYTPYGLRFFPRNS
jgi:hypothetical protein